MLPPLRSRVCSPLHAKCETIYLTKNSVSLPFTECVLAEKEPRLEIFPTQNVQRKPIGKSLILSCRADVPDSDLISDLRWRGQDNMPILPKQ